ncbi:hypothetical protein E6O75_ATG08440 [Venturia nashicola]|uniref:Uncharacterized protein n=1 Tax=Venturia nashicola TaxID=86259 RepID=A0A4Z1NVX3_9PEZI|nr:hypothetical protein E6O75_ATG08440 [Venturia nashicola]
MGGPDWRIANLWSYAFLQHAEPTNRFELRLIKWNRSPRGWLSTVHGPRSTVHSPQSTPIISYTTARIYASFIGVSTLNERGAPSYVMIEEVSFQE